MIDFRRLNLEGNPTDSEGVPLPSLFGSEGELSMGIHPNEDDTLEIRFTIPEGTFVETYPGTGVNDYTGAILRGRTIAEVFHHTGCLPCGDEEGGL